MSTGKEARARLGLQEARNDEAVVDLCLWEPPQWTPPSYLSAEARGFGAHGCLDVITSHPCPGPGVQTGPAQVLQYFDSKVRPGLKS